LKLDSKALIGIFLSSSGLSRTGPSHNSVRILSSETRLVITFSSGGVVERGIIAGFVGGVPRPPPRSSWKIGMLELSHMLRSLLYRHREEIGRFARASVGKDARTWRLVVCKAGRDGNAGVSSCCARAICKTFTKDDSTKTGFSSCQIEANSGEIRDEKRQIARKSQMKVGEGWDRER
jgi:hypothetical protein